jgi:TonB-linked SusC/RagA family outer membrane protein
VDKVFDIQRNRVVENDNYFRDYTFDATINYERTFNEDHNLKVLLATSVFKTTGSFNAYEGFDIEDNTFGSANIEDATDVRNLNDDRNTSFDTRLLSYFTRVQYDYKGKYLFSGLVRRDASSNFGPENRFGYFWSASAGWIMSDEAFLRDNSFINFLKLRVSYGTVGNDRIGSNRFVSVLDGVGIYPFDNTDVIGIAAGVLANPEIKWETQKTFDVGLDMRFLDNKFDVTMDYFNRRTEDLLVAPQVSGILGASAPGSGSPFINAGVVENKGFEFAIGYTEQFSDDVKFSIKYNVTTLDNNVVSVSQEGGFIPGGAFGIGQDPPSRMEAGQPIGYFRGFRTNGIFQNQTQIDNSPILNNNTQPGDLIFVDINGDGIIDDDDRTNIGDPIPNATMGLNLTLDFKNFDFGAYAFASVGNDIVRNYERVLARTNRTSQFLNRWTGEGSTNSFPRVTTGANNNILFSDFYVEDGSFIRLQNVQLGYSIAQETVERWGLDKLRVYVSASNLVTLTKYTGYDPTASTGQPIGGGIDYGFYPNPKTFLLGMNLKF